MAVAAPVILAGLPVQAPHRPAFGVSVTAGPGAPRAGHSYGYLVSIANPERGPAWLVHLSLSLPAGTTVAAVSGGAKGSCRIRRDGLRCDWDDVPGRSALGLSVTVRLGPRISADATLTASAVVVYDWGRMARATSVRTVAAPPPRPRPTPRPRQTPHPPPRTPPPSPRTPSPPAPPSRPAPVPLPPSSAPPSSAPPSSAPPVTIPPAGAPPARIPPPVVGVPPGTPRPPRPHPSRSPSPAAFFPGAAAKLLAPAPRQPVPGLPVGVLVIVVLVPCAAAAVTRFGRRR
jgi:hypothetical protein